jgi:hypothetical protein
MNTSVFTVNSIPHFQNATIEAELDFAGLEAK